MVSAPAPAPAPEPAPALALAPVFNEPIFDVLPSKISRFRLPNDFGDFAEYAQRLNLREKPRGCVRRTCNNCGQPKYFLLCDMDMNADCMVCIN